MVLVVAKDDTRVDLKALATRLHAGRFSFAKAELLEAVLGVAAGSVTPLALINPAAADVIVVVDATLLNFAEVNCHPLVNTATTRLATQDLIRFIQACGHAPASFRSADSGFRPVAKRLAPAHLAGLESRGA